MPRSFDMSADYEGTVEDVHRVFTETGYWQARMAVSPVDVATVESMQVNDGTIDVVTLQVVHSHNLPALVTQLHRGDLCVRREETWGPVIDGISTATIAGSLLNSPVNLSGTAVLSPISQSPITQSARARLDYRVTIQVCIPIIGSKLENLIGTQLRELVTVEQRFTSQWIMNNA